MLPGRQYSPEEILRLLWCRKWTIAGVLGLVTAVAIGAALRLPNTYRSETLILVVPQRVPESYVRSSITMRIEDRLRSIREQILTRTRLEQVITDFDLYPDLRATVPMEQLVQRMLPNIEVDPIRDDAFKVAFVADTPRTAMIVADRLASMFIDENSRDREMIAQGTNQFLESQLDDARKRLSENEKRLEDFRERYSGELPSQLETNLQVIRNTQSQIQALNESIDRDRDRRLNLDKSASDALGGIGAPGTGADSGGALVRAVDQLELARTELKSLELRLKANHPDIAAKKRAIAELERRTRDEISVKADTATAPTPATTPDLIRQARVRQGQADIAKIDKQIAQKEAEIEKLKAVLVDYQRRVDSVPAHESELTALMRDYESVQKIYTSLLARKEDSKISANLERQQVGEQFKVLDPARLPVRPHTPNRPAIAGMGLAAGLVLGLTLAGFLEYRDTTLRSEDEIVKMLSLPVVAAIPMLTSIAERKRYRRRVIIIGVTSLLLVAGGVFVVLRQFNLLQGPS